MWPLSRRLAGLLVIGFTGCGQDAKSQHARDAEARTSTRPDVADASTVAPTQKPERLVAVTFDDLPLARSNAHSLERAQAVTTGLLNQLKRANIPAIGFVNEKTLEIGNDPRPRIALLRQWLDAGMELGNHTYSHVSFWNTPLEEYKQQILDGERVTRRLLSEHGQQPRYFRHTFLNTGPDAKTKQAFEEFLAEHGYQVAPVTIDNEDVMYALAYDHAHARGDSALMRRIGRAYIEHMRESFEFYEQLSRRLFQREPAQVLMLHANALNADYLGELVLMLRERGYGFVSVAKALEDPAYRSQDSYIGRRGLSWLARWAITRGDDPGEEPRTAKWVQEIAYP